MNRCVVVAVSLLAGPAVDAKCAHMVPVPVILTTRDTNLPDDGGVLVGWENTMSDLPEVSGDPTDQLEWTASAGKLRRESLAPGLSVYFLSGSTGDVSITAKDNAKLGTFHHGPKAAAKSLPAPALAKLTLSTVKGRRWTDTHAIVTLRAAPPPAAVAVVVYSTGKNPTALSFVRLPDTHDKLLQIETYIDNGRCGFVVKSSRPPNAGEEVSIGWVDGFGRVSAPSNAVKAK